MEPKTKLVLVLLVVLLVLVIVLPFHPVSFTVIGVAGIALALWVLIPLLKYMRRRDKETRSS